MKHYPSLDLGGPLNGYGYQRPPIYTNSTHEPVDRCHKGSRRGAGTKKVAWKMYQKEILFIVIRLTFEI